MIKFDTFSELVNGAIIQEDAHLAHKAEKKRKAPAVGSSSSTPQRFRLVQSGPQRAPFSTSHSSSGDTGPFSTLSHRGQSGLLLLSKMSRRSGCSSRGCAPICFRVTTMGSRGTLHGTAQCHPSKANNLVHRIRKARWFTSSRGKCTTPPSRVSQRGAPVMAGTFSVNEQSVTVLFDSGVSYTFISKECVVRLGLKIESMPKPYHIHSPGGKLITNQIVKSCSE